MPLTADRAKPAVPFGGHYRLVDFALSNLVNAGYRRIVVLTQYKSHSLDRHVSTTWRLSPLLGNYVAPVPAQMRRGPYWFQGSADAIHQNLNLLRDEKPQIVCVFGADVLLDAVCADAEARDSAHDMGGDIIPMLVDSGQAHVYDFTRNEVPGATDRDRGYWRDVGTLDAFYDAHMDLISVHPVFNLYNRAWPILTWPEPLPPAKFVFEEEDGRIGHALNSKIGRAHV